MTAGATDRRDGARAFTMIELLVTLGIFAVVIGSVLSVFMAGIRTGVRSQRKREAGRVALAVFDLLQKGWEKDATWYGRDGDGKVVDTDATGPIASDSMPTIHADLPANWTAWAPAYVVRSPVPLVWEAKIDTHLVDGVDMYRLRVTVWFDEDRNGAQSSGDRKIGDYQALLADRRAP